MGQGGHVPMNPLAERAQQLQQQLQQLQALQALQMPQQSMSSPQMGDLQGGFDNLSLQGQLLGGGGGGGGGQTTAQQMQQAQVAHPSRSSEMGTIPALSLFCIPPSGLEHS